MRLHRNAKTTPAGRLLLVRRVREAGWSVEDAINLRRALWGDPKYRFRLLVDARSGNTTPRDSAFFRRLATELQRERPASLPREKTAYVVGRDLDFGVSRMAEAHLEAAEMPVDIRVFRDLAEARAWLEENGEAT